MPVAKQPPVVVAAGKGDRLATLEAVRDLIAAQLARHDMPAREIAALAGRLQSVLAEIAELKPPAEESKGTPLDELNARRVARGAAPAARTRPARG